ncbi:MAG: hypothetical protein JO086_14410 [Acidimicrobiia bacterium]|nr:hypothetical protein [Acidimicrobiia bacterium]
MTSLIGLVVVDSLAWAGWSALVGYACHRLPAGALANDNFVTRPRAFEDDGRLYERTRIRRWKDRLPDAGALFSGGVSKRHLRGRDADGLRDFAIETRRAELVHWLVAATTPVFAFWNPPALLAAMAAYGVVANLPFIAIQRYNRARIIRVLR